METTPGTAQWKGFLRNFKDSLLYLGISTTGWSGLCRKKKNGPPPSRCDTGTSARVEGASMGRTGEDKDHSSSSSSSRMGRRKKGGIGGGGRPWSVERKMFNCYLA